MVSPRRFSSQCLCKGVPSFCLFRVFCPHVFVLPWVDPLHMLRPVIQSGVIVALKNEMHKHCTPYEHLVLV